MLKTLHALWQVSSCEVRLRLLGFQKVAGALLEAPPAGLSRQWTTAQSPLRYLESTATVPWSTCLTRAVAAASRLRRQGYPAQLRLGTRSGARFSAHAWVEIAGQAWSEHGHEAMQQVDEAGLNSL